MNDTNTTIAKVINYLIPTAKATQGSVASMIRFLKVKEDKSKEKQLLKAGYFKVFDGYGAYIFLQFFFIFCFVSVYYVVIVF